MRKILPVVLIIPALLLTGCSNSSNTERQFITEGGEAEKKISQTATPPATANGGSKITPPDTALGDTTIKVETNTEDNTFTAPKIDLNNSTPPNTTNPEEVKTYTDFKNIITASLNKMNETGIIEKRTAEGKTTTFVIVKTGDKYKAAVQSDNSKTPDLLQSITMFAPVIAETSLNAQKGTYTTIGNTYTVSTPTGIYAFTVTNGLITGMNVTGTETVKFAPSSSTIEYTTNSESLNIANTAVLPPW